MLMVRSKIMNMTAAQANAMEHMAEEDDDPDLEGERFFTSKKIKIMLKRACSHR
jgi:hypothetical protein